jgi:hypothetical protein
MHAAEAAAGGTPMLISKVEEMVPNAIPSAPSTICSGKSDRNERQKLVQSEGREVEHSIP